MSATGSTPTTPVDALILGAGPAGLTTALGLCRQNHTSIVFDSKSYRNARTSHMHTVPTWDHKDPAEFKAAARENTLANYSTVEFIDTEIVRVGKVEDREKKKAGEATLFEAEDGKGGKWFGRKLVLATGVVDVYPNIEGFDECWAHGIFHCLFCYGYEERNKPSSGILAVEDFTSPPYVLHFARSALQITPRKVTIYTNGSMRLRGEMHLALAPSSPSSPIPPIAVDPRPIQRLEKSPKDSEVIIHFTDGSQATEAFLAYKPKTKLKGPFAEQLGLELTAKGDVAVVLPFYQASGVRGVFVAGDAAGPLKVVNHALMSGTAVAAGLSAQVQAERWEQKGLL